MAYSIQRATHDTMEQLLVATARFFDDAAIRYASYRIYREGLAELRALSDRELADLGLHRSGLKRIAAEAADRKVA